MAESPANDTSDDIGTGPPSTPLWVKVFGGILIVLVLLFVILHLTGHSLGGIVPAGGHH